ncbi:Crossover junction endodeoxyribonuclease RuvC [compost metagenome]
MEKILAFDPSLASTGWAVLDGREVIAMGKIVTDPKYTEMVRMDEIYKEVQALCLEYKPDVVVMEDQYMGPNPQTSLMLGRVRGVAMIACYRAGANVFVYAPSEIKKVVTGKGNAKKEAVQQGVINLFSNSEIVQQAFVDGVKTSGKKKNDDISDALGIAYTHIELQAGRAV